jgi:hypothetical protein
MQRIGEALQRSQRAEGNRAITKPLRGGYKCVHIMDHERNKIELREAVDEEYDKMQLI